MIKAVAHKNSNYIFHMLSVSKCGYDNEYGSNLRGFHDEADLDVLRKYKKHITVSGGEHCGVLYDLLISRPASQYSKESFFKYLNAIKNLFSKRKPRQNFRLFQDIYVHAFNNLGVPINEKNHEDLYKSYLDFINPIIEIIDVILSNYGIYEKTIWPKFETRLKEYCISLNSALSEINLIGSWQQQLGVIYKHDIFEAVICNSIENGPQAIDISQTKDVFLINNNIEELVKLISHEFGIYLLKEALSGTDAFKNFSNYEAVESLAEYHNQIICGGYEAFDWKQANIDKYFLIYQSKPEISTLEAYIAFQKRES